MLAIEATGLCKAYGGKCAVDELRFEVRQGEVFALLGMNGAGKTTTIRMLTGITAPDSGDACVFGHSILSQATEMKRLIGVSPQESAVAPKLSVRENLEFSAEIHGYSRTEARLRAQEMLRRMGMDEIATKRAEKLSGGWQRRLSIAMALMNGPKLLFLDEPTLGLDVLARREFWSLIRGLRGQVTVLLTTHYLEEAEALSDRIGILRDGRLQAVGTAAELKVMASAESFEDAFVRLASGEVEQ